MAGKKPRSIAVLRRIITGSDDDKINTITAKESLLLQRDSLRRFRKIQKKAHTPKALLARERETSAQYRALAERNGHEANAMKAKVFDATAAHSPWIRQNNAIRKIVEDWHKTGRPRSVVPLTAIAKELGL